MPGLQYGTDGPSNAGTVSSSKSTFTVEDAIEKVGFGFLQLRIYVICKLVVATDALEIMLLSLVGPVVQCEWKLKEAEVAFISTAVFFGMAISSPAVGLLADHYGRRTSLLITTLWTAYFGLLTTFSPIYYWLLLLRGLVGVGMGGVPQGYAMVAEYVPSRYRAKMIVFGETFWAAASLFEIMLAALVTPSLGWRWLFAFTAIPVIIATFCCCSIPESTRYLLAAGKREKALSILHRLAAVNKTSLPNGSLVKSLKVPLGSWKDLVSPEYKRTTLLLWPIWFGVNFAYYGIVLASPILLTKGQTPSEDTCASTCHSLKSSDYISLATSTAGEFVGLFFSFILVDWIGRRWTGRLLFLIAAAFLFLLQIADGIVLTTIFTFGVRGSTLTLFNLCFIYTVEVYPTTMRALGLGICTSFGRAASMVTPFLAQMLMVYSVPIAVTIYGCVCIVCALFMFLLPIETAGRPMMQSVSYTVEGSPEETNSLQPEDSDGIY